MSTESPPALTDLLHRVQARYRLVHVDETQSVLLLYLERLLRAAGCDVLRLRHLQSMVEVLAASRPARAATSPGTPARAAEMIVALEYSGSGSAGRLLQVGAELQATDFWELGWDRVPPAERSDRDDADPDKTLPIKVQPRILRRSLREAVYAEGREALQQALRKLLAEWDAAPESRCYVDLLLRGDDPDPRPVEAEAALSRWLEAYAVPRSAPSSGTPGSRASEIERPIFLLVGAPGAGKTTLLRHFAAGLSHKHLAEAEAGAALPRVRAPILLTVPQELRRAPGDEAPDLDRLLDGAVPGLSGKMVRLWAELGLCVLLLDGPLPPATLQRLQQPTLVGGFPTKVLLCAGARYFVQERGGHRATHLIIEAAVRSGWDLGYLDPLNDERLQQYLLLKVPDPMERSAGLAQLARSDNLRRLCRRIGLLAALTQEPVLLGAGVARGEPAPPLLALHQALHPGWLEGVGGDRRIERTAREALARVLARRLLSAPGDSVPWWDLIPEVGAELSAEQDGARLLLHLLRALDDTMFIIDSAQRSAAPSIDSAQRSTAPFVDSAQRSAAPSIDSAKSEQATPRLRFALASAADYFIGEDIANRLTQVPVARVTACLQRGHTGPVRAIALSPTGRLCATGSDDRTVRLWEAGSGFLLRVLHGHHDPVTAVAFVSAASTAACDAPLVVSTSLDFTARVWDARTGRGVRTLVGHTDGIIGLGQAPGRGLLATASLDGTVRIWEVGGRCHRTLRPKVERLTAVALSPDGLFCAVSSEGGLVHVFHSLSGQLLTLLGGHRGAVLSVALSPDGKLVASGGRDLTIRLTELKSGRLIQSLLGHEGEVTSLSFSPDGRLLASGGEDQTVRVFALPAPGEHTPARLLHCQKEPRGPVNSVAFAAPVPVPRHGPPRPHHHHGSAYTLATATHEAGRLWDAAFGQALRVLDGSAAGSSAPLSEAAIAVTALSASPDGELVAAGGGDGGVRIWDVQRGRLLMDLRGHEGAVLSAAFSPDGRMLATGSADQSVRLWDRYTGEEIDTFEGHYSDVVTLSFSPDGYLLASGSDDQTVRVREVAGGMTVQTFAHGGPVTQVVFAPDGRHLISAAADGRLRVFATAGGPMVQEMRKHLSRVRGLAVSPDGKLLASAGDDHLLRVWDARTGRSMHALFGHLSGVAAVAFSPDGLAVASAGDDQTVRLWEARSGRALMTWSGSGPLGSLAFLPDGRLVTGGQDGLFLLHGSEGRVLGQMQALGEGWLALAPVEDHDAEQRERPNPRWALFAAEPEAPPGLRMSDGWISYPCAGWVRLCQRPHLVAQSLSGGPCLSLKELQGELAAAPVPMPVLESSGSRASPLPQTLFFSEVRPGAVGPGRMVTADELLSADTSTRGELVRGEVVPTSPTTYAPGRVSGRLHAYLVMHVFPRNLGDLPSSDTGYLLQRDPDVVRAPDVSFVSRERVPQGGTSGFFTGAPDLAAEVISPANVWEVVERKAQEYLSTGSRLVWVVDPQTRTVHVHESPVRVRILGEADQLTGGSVLPGFTVAVRDLFA